MKELNIEKAIKEIDSSLDFYWCNSCIEIENQAPAWNQIKEALSSSSPSSIERLEITQERANEILSFFNNQKELEPEFADALQKLVESKVNNEPSKKRF